MTSADCVEIDDTVRSDDADTDTCNTGSDVQTRCG